jgi:hypothetical protein
VAQSRRILINRDPGIDADRSVPQRPWGAVARGLLTERKPEACYLEPHAGLAPIRAARWIHDLVAELPGGLLPQPSLTDLVVAEGRSCPITDPVQDDARIILVLFAGSASRRLNGSLFADNLRTRWSTSL